MSCVLVTAIANTGHNILPLEPPSYSVVNTLWLAPACLQKINKFGSCYLFSLHVVLVTSPELNGTGREWNEVSSNMLILLA